jgi:hypothetical protein
MVPPRSTFGRRSYSSPSTTDRRTRAAGGFVRPLRATSGVSADDDPRARSGRVPASGGARSDAVSLLQPCKAAATG